MAYYSEEQIVPTRIEQAACWLSVFLRGELLSSNFTFRSVILRVGFKLFAV